MCRQAPSIERISTGQVKKFIKESIKANRKWKKIVISGGESILEDNCLEILDLLLEYQKKHNPRVKLVLLTNNRGNKVQELLKQVPKGIEVLGSNKTSSFNPSFVSINAAPCDNPKYKNANYEAGCRLTHDCGGAINKNGYYVCSTASAIDRVLKLNLAKKSLPEPNEQFLKQRQMLCRYCGYFLHSDNYLEKGYQSKSWQKTIRAYRGHPNQHKKP
jgi:hypothetical protein